MKHKGSNGEQVKGDCLKLRKNTFNRLLSLILATILVISVFPVIVSASPAAWTQTTRGDFEAGTLENLDTTSSPGDVMLSGTDTENVSYTGGTTNADLASFPGIWGDPGQSFTVGGSDISVAKVELYLSKNGTPSDIYLEIRNESMTGTVLGTSNNTITAGDLTTSLAWKEFTFSTPVMLSANTKYYLRIRSNGTNGFIFWGYKHSSPDPYAGGLPWHGWKSLLSSYKHSSPDPYAGGDAYRYTPVNLQKLDYYDFSFKVYDRKYSASGTLTSSTHDSGGTYDWGTISWNATVPAGTTLKFQIRTTHNGYDTGFVGPDGKKRLLLHYSRNSNLGWS
jgi:hypothetical protein